MKQLLLFIQRTFLVLWILFLSCCSNPLPRQWTIESSLTKYPRFNSGMMLLEADSDISYIDLQIIRSISGLNMYINILLLKTPPLPEDSKRTTLELLVEGQDPYLFHPYILNGEQKLLVPNEVADYIIQLLLEDQTVVIKAGRFIITVIPDNFQEAYEELMTMPILKDEC